MKKNIPYIIIILLLAVAVWHFVSERDDHDDPHGHEYSLEAKEPVRADGQFTIAASFYPLAFIAETLTEGVAEVINIGEGRDPHDVTLSTSDVLTLQQADLVVMQGADLEPWGDKMIDQLRDEEIPVLVAAQELKLKKSEDEHEKDEEHEEKDEEHHDEEDGDEHEEDEDDHGHGEFDPHTWLDPVLFAETVAELVEVLEALDPENAEFYEERGEVMMSELKALDKEYSTLLSTCPNNEVIASHDAFGYIGERYNLEIHAIGGLSTQDLPSAQTLAELSEEAREGVFAILLEENSIAAYGETLANETGLQTLSVNPISYLVPEGEDYFTIMQSNLDTFADALQCK